MELDGQTLCPPGPHIRTIRVTLYGVEWAKPDLANQISEVMDSWMVEYGFRLYRRAVALNCPTNAPFLIWELDREKFWNEPKGNDRFFKQDFYVKSDPEGYPQSGFFSIVTFLYWYPGK